jgi:chemotaxis protein MotA
MAIDDMSYADVEAIMRQEATATHARHKRAAEVVRRAAEVAPAMGLIGTLVGLVQMLRNLDDPAAIGPGMAVALLTTFYGAIMGTMVLAPLADKLERNAAEERRINHLYILTVLSIIRRDNPRRLEILLNAVAAPEDRVSYFP